MKKNIAATITFSEKNIFFTVIETINTQQVEIFSSNDSIRNASPFLEKVVPQANAIIGGTISEVFVVVNSSTKTNGKIKPYVHVIDIAGDNVSKKDIENAISLSKINFESNDSRVTLVQPVKFEVFDVLWKAYSKAPISKKGSKLKITSVVTTISKNVFDFIEKVIGSQGLNIKEILLSQQAISQVNLSESALTDGSVLIHIDEHQSFITINKNLSTIASMSIYDFGYKQLISGIAKIFGVQKSEARDLVTLYGSLNEDINRVIISKKRTDTTKIYTTVDLNRIIKAFITKLLLVSKQFLGQKNVSDLPVIISGRVEQMDGVLEFSKTQLETDSVSVYNAISFIEISSKNKEAIGATLFNKRIDEINGRQLNTIVETNPNLVSSLKKKNNTNVLHKIIEKIGGKNVWK